MKRLYNPGEYFIICANVPGGCYGSTGPLSRCLRTGKEYFHAFPQITIRDMVKAFHGHDGFLTETDQLNFVLNSKHRRLGKRAS